MRVEDSTHSKAVTHQIKESAGHVREEERNISDSRYETKES
jgi:hypothetical protein